MSLVAAGGWAVPSEMYYDPFATSSIYDYHPNPTLRKTPGIKFTFEDLYGPLMISAKRGGIEFKKSTHARNSEMHGE